MLGNVTCFRYIYWKFRKIRQNELIYQIEKNLLQQWEKDATNRNFFLQIADIPYKSQLFSIKKNLFLEIPTIFFSVATFFCNLAIFFYKSQLFSSILQLFSTNRSLFIQSCNYFLQTTTFF